MLLYAVDAGNGAELKCAVMASVKQAGGKHRQLAGRDMQVGLLKGHQIARYCTALEDYAAHRPKFPPVNQDLLDMIVRSLRGDGYCSVFIADKTARAEIYVSFLLGTFDGVMDTVDVIDGALTQLDIDLAALKPSVKTSPTAA